MRARAHPVNLMDSRFPKSFRWVLQLCFGGVVTLLLGVCGCVPTAVPRSAGEPAALREVRDAYERTVFAAVNDPETRWRSGWSGNIMLNLADAEAKGRCFEWQMLVYEGVREAAARVGWDCDGVALNLDIEDEHHAVIVWDPTLVSRGEILGPPVSGQVWVLDAWRTGTAAVHGLADWVRWGTFMPRTVVLEDLEAQRERLAALKRTRASGRSSTDSPQLRWDAR